MLRDSGGLGSSMAGIAFLMAALFAGAAFVFKQAAAELHGGTSWAGEVCTASQTFCHHPEYLAYGGEVLFVLAISVKLSRLAS
jgi:hypothetical protein